MSVDAIAQSAKGLPVEEKLLFIEGLRCLLEAGGSAPPEIVYQPIQGGEMLGREFTLAGIKSADQAI